jgi:prepilin-type N-terminal cleavage/methylation domain-containing protein
MQGEKGFTLVEVLVAMVVFSLAILAVGKMQIVAMQVTSAASRLTRGTTIAQDTIEQLMTLPYTDALLSDATEVGEVTTRTDQTDPDRIKPPQGYSITLSVDQDTPSAGVKTINLTVTWKNRGQPKSFSLAFFKESV